MDATFIDHSTHSRKLFVAVGNAELNKKVASYTKDHKLSIIKTYQFSSGCCAAVERQYHPEFSPMLHNRGTPSAGLLNSLKKRVVCDKCEKRRNRNASIRTEEALSVAEETISRIQKQNLAQQIGDSPSTMRNICCDDLSMSPTQCN